MNQDPNFDPNDDFTENGAGSTRGMKRKVNKVKIKMIRYDWNWDSNFEAPQIPLSRPQSISSRNYMTEEEYRESITRLNQLLIQLFKNRRAETLIWYIW